jgi:shikimate dehydrogenase
MLRFALLGHPVSHSLSPAMHEASFRALGLDAAYTAIDVEPAGLPGAVRLLQSRGFLGLNITIPHKEAALALVDRPDGLARDIGAVNTIRFAPDGKTEGFNTDAQGFLDDLRASLGATPEGLDIFLLGCGGAGRALAFACASSGCARLFLANRTLPKAEALARDIRRRFPRGPLAEAVPSGEGQWASAARACRLVLHCTPSGLRPGDPSPLPPSAFRPGQLLYDIVYTSPRTPVIRAALASGATAANGLGMLLRQGAASFKIWTGLDADLPAMLRALDGAQAPASPARP